MRTSSNGIKFIMQEEGCRLKAYRLEGEKYYTIGVGHYGPDVKEGQTITREQAEKLLKEDVRRFEIAVDTIVLNIKMTQNMFDALVSYTYNRGEGGLRQLVTHSSSVKEYAENIVKYWGSATRYKSALIERRKREKALFLKGYKAPASHIQLNYKAGNGYKALVTLNIRDKPSTAGRKIGTIVSGTTVKNQATTRAGEAIWMYIGLDQSGRERWICADTGDKKYIG